MNNFALFLAFLFVSCASTTMEIGRDFSDRHINDIVKGVTTKSQILQMFGNPFGTTVNDSTETWTYTYSRSVGKATSFVGVTNATGKVYSKSLTLTFDRAGTVRTFSYTVNGDRGSVFP